MLVHVLVFITKNDVTEVFCHAHAHARIARLVIERRQMAGRRQAARLSLFQCLEVALLTVEFFTSNPNNNIISNLRPVATLSRIYSCKVCTNSPPAMLLSSKQLQGCKPETPINA
jgi:hypothetical protein